jgi:acetate kinase
MSRLIATLNAGSSSLKFSVYRERDGQLESLFRGQAEGLFTTPHFLVRDHAGQTVAETDWPAGTGLGHAGAIERLFQWADEVRAQLRGERLAAVGHRVVHGGLKYSAPIRVDAQVLAELEELIPLAPLHQPHNLTLIRALQERRPDLPQVGCFDTAFHRTQPEVAQAFALPRAYTEQGVRRYGFHGLSYEYIAAELPRYDPRAAAGRVVVAHLGNGASLCALRNGRSVATTMGFTALDGLPMGTRCGAVDPGVLLFFLNHLHLDASAIQSLLYNESGLLGVSGISSDMRTLLASSDPRAAEAVDLYVYRIGRELGSLAAAMGGLDALVFTAGIGEHAAEVRARICRGAAWLGVALDEAANDAGGPRISRDASAVSAWVIPTDEELMIARHTARMTTV